MRVLVVNPGSSSLKLRLLGRGDEVLASGDLPATGTRAVTAEIGELVAAIGSVDAVGHRVVHGGVRFRAPVLIDDAVVADLEALVPLAPLHQPGALAAIAQVRDLLPGVPNVACFDTAFHATLPEAAATYAIPAEWRARWDLRRFGFHGLAHAYAARRGAELAGAPLGQLRMVTCQLGSGASLAAVRAGVSVDTTMGFTPLEGLVMATRPGNVDPGLLLWLIEQCGMDPEEMSEGLRHRSGLRGLAGTSDMRAVLERAAAGDANAALARDVYVHRLRGAIAAMAAAAGGLDVLVFSGGVGEHAAAVRAATADGLGFLGVALDPQANEAAHGDAAIGAAGAASATVVVTAREELEIARQVRSVLGAVGA